LSLAKFTLTLLIPELSGRLSVCAGDAAFGDI
jgi:hypothetical protein